MIELKGLQPVWEQSIIDKQKTTAELIPGNPINKGVVFQTTEEWEGNAFRYPNVIYEDGKYRMYYLSHVQWDEKIEDNGNVEGTTITILNIFVCYAESDDGINWVKPSLGICEYNGSKDNNIILMSADKPEKGGFFDNFFVFKDTNPNCEPEKRYKALAYMNLYQLGCYTSADGIHFNYERTFDLDGKFDTLNVCWWDEQIGKYVAYIRDFHDIPEGDLNAGIRDIRRTESEDFINWTTPVLIKFNETEDYPIYTSNICRYYRNPDILIGFPTRYVERPCWNENYEQLCGRDDRLESMEKESKRAGLAVTDSIFMASRDGLNWDKIDEALFTPGPEF